MSSENLNTAGAFSQAKDLKNRILFTILLLCVYRLGTYVPLSGIDPQALKEVMDTTQKGLFSIVKHLRFFDVKTSTICFAFLHIFLQMFLQCFT